MKRLATLSLLLLLIGGVDTSQGQVLAVTGKIGFRLTNGGSTRIGVPVAVAPNRHIDRATVIYAFDSTSVFDYNDDQDVRAGYSAKFFETPLADTAASTLTDGVYGGIFPDIAVRVTVYGWNNEWGYLVQHTVINETTAPLKGYLALAVVPWLTELYGFESIEYDATNKVAYYYRSGEPAHVGFKVVSGDPYSFHSLDWEAYSTDPDNEVTTDAARYFLTAPPGFDPKLDAGNVGSILHLTAGYREVQPGDSTSVTYAIVYGTSPAEVFTAASAMQERYNGMVSSVEPVAGGLPDRYDLRQNYPNPFNPSTQIRFDVPASGFVSIRVYDLLGREVASLVNQELNAGTYEIQFSGENLPSGTYIATMQSGDYRASHKMMLLK